MLLEVENTRERGGSAYIYVNVRGQQPTLLRARFRCSFAFLSRVAAFGGALPLSGARVAALERTRRHAAFCWYSHARDELKSRQNKAARAFCR